jgi:hypothetical protein
MASSGSSSGSARAHHHSHSPPVAAAVAQIVPQTGDPVLDERIAGVISLLKFISKIKPDQKIEVEGLQLCSTTLLGRAYRHFVTPNESKDTTYEFLAETFQESFDVLQVLQTHNTPYTNHVSALLIQDTAAALESVPKLITTYREQAYFVSRLETLRDTMTLKLDTARRQVSASVASS